MFTRAHQCNHVHKSPLMQPCSQEPTTGTFFTELNVCLTFTHCLKSTLIVSSHLCVGFTECHLAIQIFWTNFSVHFSFLLCMLHVRTSSRYFLWLVANAVAVCQHFVIHTAVLDVGHWLNTRNTGSYTRWLCFHLEVGLLLYCRTYSIFKMAAVVTFTHRTI